MKFSDVGELFNLVAIANVPSIMEHGILSHDEVRRRGLGHESIADPRVQAQRDTLKVGGRRLHSNANLFICARNPMLFVVKKSRGGNDEGLAVLRVDPSVMLLPNVIITDGFAYSGWSRPYPSPEGLDHIDFDEVHAEFWTNHELQKDVFRHKSRKCAEILVPTRVDPDQIVGAYASCEPTAELLRGIMPGRDVRVAPYVFFR